MDEDNWSWSCLPCISSSFSSIISSSWIWKREKMTYNYCPKKIGSVTQTWKNRRLNRIEYQGSLSFHIIKVEVPTTNPTFILILHIFLRVLKMQKTKYNLAEHLSSQYMSITTSKPMNRRYSWRVIIPVKLTATY